jgi:hypothetical protein
MKAIWIGHILRRNCLLKHAIEGKIDGRRSSYWMTSRKKRIFGNLKEEKS